MKRMHSGKSLKSLKPRSKPRQERSRERVDFILDTAEKLVQQLGPEVVTAQMISKETKISPGVIYHYFPGKHGIFAAIVQRVFFRLEEMMREIGEGCRDKIPYDVYADLVVESLAKHFHANRSAMMLWMSLEYTPQMEPVTRKLNQAAIERNIRTIKNYCPNIDSDTIYTKALTFKAISFAMLKETLFHQPSKNEMILAELKSVLVSLLKPWL